ncbi:class I adenylate-forming enzyme family protein [Bacillus dakarensis]|uniref:class I adenylate-forming enzyme family protein n=1 Tax=Robertmurraya dakarensis TaxID=1926278 RepID=UPI0009815EBB|nr:class I adenylate-forming enzyme family protein [Bacillus dakarensis]
MEVKDITKVTLFGRENVKVFANRPSTLREVVKNTVSKFGNKDALILDGGYMTYQELDKESDALIAAMQNKYNIQKGDRIVSLISNRFEFATVVLACIKSGIIMVPVNIKLTAPEITYILSHSKPKLIIADEELCSLVEECNQYDSEVMPYTKNLVCIGNASAKYDRFSTLLAEQQPPKEVELTETDPAFLLYTSGTTGRPKGATISHINVIHSIMHFQRAYNSTEDVRTMLAVPFFHVTGLVAQFLHILYIGGSMVILKTYQNEKYIKQCYEYKVNFQLNVPTIFAMMATSPLLKEYSFDFVKMVGYGGSPIYQQTLEMLKQVFPNATYHNVYGATETTSPTTIMPASYPMSKATSVGLPVETGDVKIVDDHDNEAGVNEIGELLIKGPMVIGEYWDNPEANKTSFIDGYWRSGDLAKVDEDGFIYIMDRKKDMINRGGEKIFSIEVEDVLKKHPEIIEAAVVAVPDEIFGERVKAIIVSDTLNDDSTDAIRSYCKQYLAKFKVPELFEFMEELPKTASGKVLKHTLR